MNWSITLLRVRGIPVKVHLTFLLILVWAAAVWGSGPNGGLTGALFGVVAMILLFGCVTLHELAHSVVAMHYGIPVHEILLLPIGGVSEIEDLPSKPGQELRIALAGPLVSLVLAALFFVLTVAFGATASLSLTPTSYNFSSLIAYLAAANFVLAAFNLLPAFPMDGGRVLRAALATRMSYRAATSTSAAVGQGFALLLGLLGVATGNLIYILVAIFIWTGAGSENGQAQVDDAMRDATVDAAMSREPHTLRRTDELARAVDLTLSTFQSEFPVLDDGSLVPVGLLTREDLLRGLHAEGSAARVDQSMHRSFYVVSPSDRLAEVQRSLAASPGRCAVVVDAGKVVGLLTATDAAEAALLFANRLASQKA